MKDPKLISIRNKQIAILDKKIMALKLIWDKKKVLLDYYDGEYKLITVDELYKLVPNLKNTLPNDSSFLFCLREALRDSFLNCKSFSSFIKYFL